MPARRRKKTEPLAEAEASALALLGLAMRAGRLVVGTTAVKDAARGGRLRGALIARDAGPNARDRVLPLLAATGVPVARCGTVKALGKATGRERLAAVGITDAGFASRLMTGLPVEETKDRSQDC